MSSRTPVAHTMKELREREREIFQKIPGMPELLAAHFSADAVSQYPDAAFAWMISESLLRGDREQCEINQRAYFSVLNGDSIANVRARYDADQKRYMERHMWDD